MLVLYLPLSLSSLFFFTAPATTEISTLSLHDALPISVSPPASPNGTRLARNLSRTRNAAPNLWRVTMKSRAAWRDFRSEEHTSELQSPDHLVCRLLLEKKKKNTTN